MLKKAKSIKRRLLKAYESMFPFRSEKKRFYEGQGYNFNLENPSSFSEKIIWKKMFDRNPLLPLTADKYQVRYYIEDVLGKEKAKEVLIPLLYVTDNPEDITFDELPDSYIVKANNGSNRNLIVENNDKSEDEIKFKCWEWLKTPYNRDKYEWAYQEIEPKIIIEELIKDKEGNIPNDYKFHIFHGECRLVEVDFDRFSGRSRSLFSPKWEYIPVQHNFKKGKVINQPKKYEVMVELAEKIGKEFDYVRVDLYNIEGDIYFGELTHYPGSGYTFFEPRSFDFKLGKHWVVVPEYWKGKTINQ